MRPFGCPVTILNTLDHLAKFDGKADEGFFIGYSLNIKAFRVFNSRKRIVEENLRIRFSESTPIIVGSRPDWLFDIDALTRTMNYEPIFAGTQSKDFVDKEDNVNSTNNVNAAGTNKVNALVRKISIKLPDDLNLSALEDISTFNFSNDDDDDAVANMNNLDTTIQEELLQFKLQEVWTLVDLPNGKNPIGTKWVFRNKEDERVIVIKNKARLVAQVYTQEEWIDYDEVFSPIAIIEAIRLFLAYASFKDFVVYQMDVKSVFLYGKIEEEVYVCQPPRFEDPDFHDRVYNVEIALHKGDILMLKVYVDDIIFGSTKKEPCNAFEKLMHERFQMISMGEITFFLGLQVNQKKDGIFNCPDKYVGEILKKFRFTEVKTASTLMETQKPLLKDEDGVKVDVHMYRAEHFNRSTGLDWQIGPHRTDPTEPNVFRSSPR
nr:retrovirus-related Pol polyprotein from transposon TNT 1-94 [Tanacetum cinerariifolium]